ncbi:hypothetical protein THSYN_09990 [Candidatus Thiodictyon syntrophicum]|jgi:hypothetical protein|uniref:Uncharacterized protein n=1 Tax=Candidatus Thiodictyon syntrophicum TaxID=1166950 RepID=A0A2K8U867_9GAMM|nr:hypothetical protein THSYN_09990 [Candidatus Thiodictyon syntrophicum]
MYASALLHSWLGQWLSGIHSKRLVSLLDMVAAGVAGTGLSITSVAPGVRIEVAPRGGFV